MDMRLSVRDHSGFTLIELSVIVVIIGLIVGGVVIGRDIIRNAEMQSVISDVNRFRNAAKMFQEKYKYLPGDFPNAASLWGADTGCTTSTPNADATTNNATRKKETCGGNGDGMIVGYNGSGAIPTAVSIGNTQRYREALRLWQHLANAELIEGSYSGAPSNGSAGNGANNGLAPGLNIPKSKLGSNTGYTMFQAYVINGSNQTITGETVGTLYPASYGHVIQHGNPLAQSTLAWSGNAYPGMTAADAAAIDQKIDDGKPAYGNVLSYADEIFSGVPNCASSASPDSAEYQITVEGVNCALIFITGF